MGLGRQLGSAIRWFERNLFVELCSIGFATALVGGMLDGLRWPALLTAAVLAMLMVVRLTRLARRFQAQRVSEPGERAEVLQLELLLVCAVFLLLQLTGSIASPLYPALFLLLVAIGGFDGSVLNRIVIVLASCVLETLAWLAADHAVPQPVIIIHFAAIAGFPFLVGALEWAWTKSERRKRDAEIQKRLHDAEREAEEYRFIGMTTSADRQIPVDKRRKDLQLSSVRQLGLGVKNILGVLEAALRPHTVALYWISVDESTAALKDAICASSARLRPSLDAGEGVIGAILKGRKIICKNHLRKVDRLFVYYDKPPHLRAFVGVPLLESLPGESDGPSHLRGVLLADRKSDVPFGDDDIKLLGVACVEIIRIWRTERQLNRMDEIRNEAEGLNQATQGLIEAVTLQEVVDEVAASLRAIYKSANFASVVLSENEGRSLIIKSVDADEQFEAWKADNLNRDIARRNHLCSLSMRKGMILPDSAFDKRSRSQRKIFGDRQDPPGLRSVKVAPLKLASPEDVNIGALVVGGTSATLFEERGGRGEDVKRTLETVSNIAAISIQNARRYEQLEELATTDPLTGLHNRRRFFEMMDEAVAESIRYERPLSLIMADIDRFKNVNDTYGHPVGDEVLKRVARVLNELARSTDRVCRVGGEEFTILMPETDQAGGLMLAERFRTEISKQEFRHNGQTFNISLSLGICTIPQHARHEQELFHRADQALYYAKNHGRDQSVHFADIARDHQAEKLT